MTILFPKKINEYELFQMDGCISNVFAVKTSSGVFLIDPSVSGDTGRVASFLRNEVGVAPEEVAFSYVSHMHPDHSGGAVALRRQFGIPIAAHHSATLWYGGFRGYIQYLLDCFMTVQVVRRQKTRTDTVSFNRILSPEIPLMDGAQVPGFQGWRCIHVPGHTCHDLVLYHQGSGLLYAADIIVKVRKRLDLPMPILFPKTMMASYEKLKNLELQTVLVAHGPALAAPEISGLFDHMQALLFKPKSRLAKKVDWLSCYSREIEYGRIFEKSLNLTK